ncbi:peroxiredoxin 1 [Malassezia vespertilionis]|uniref:peroxiredoxin 1 n=1 Tax=Malassezia vespertilionis TaxID=2020962 RepID=UPI0024B14AC6|nr:peroxiredoxin 1 [Malassezia vespertilionis]WFD05019.1 peroxiredoxin 1 [Malassezia vespertilionis]
MPALRLGSTAPDFVAETTQYVDKRYGYLYNSGLIRFHEWIDQSWAVLFSHPDDFTPVCTTELGDVAVRAEQFAARGVKVIGISANSVASHIVWIQDINDVASACVHFPIIGDRDRKVSALYGMLDEQDLSNTDSTGMPYTVRDVFVIDPNKVIRLKISYPASTGRNFDEILRAIDSLQLGDAYPIVTPANWNPGQKVIVHAKLGNEEAKKHFQVYDTKKPYLRYTDDPRKSIKASLWDKICALFSKSYAADKDNA